MTSRLDALPEAELRTIIKNIAGDQGDIAEYLHDIAPQQHGTLADWFDAMTRAELVDTIKLIASECADGYEKVDMYIQ